MKRISKIAIGLATCVLAFPASASVIYSNLLDTTIPTDFTGTTVAIGSGTLNPFFGGVAVANSTTLQPFRTGTDGMASILNFSQGAPIDAGSLNLASGPGGSQTHLGNTFTAGQEGYIGFKLDNNKYGWVRVVFTNNTGGAKIKDWAYDDSGAAIVAGGIQQSGQNVTLSAMTLSSVLANSGGTTNLVKNTAGTTALTGTNLYTGLTTVSSGTLAVNGSGSINTSSGVTINGGTFRYNSEVALASLVSFTNGTIGGTNLTGTLGGLTIGSGQTLSPGNSIGTATTDSQTWGSGGTYEFEIGNATGSAGTGWDLLTGTGTLSVTATAESRFTIAVKALGLGIPGEDVQNFNDLAGYGWLIADFNTAVDSFSADKFSIDTTAFTNPFSGQFSVAQGGSVLWGSGDNTQLYLIYTPVPEPGCALLCSLTLLLALRRRRRE